MVNDYLYAFLFGYVLSPAHTGIYIPPGLVYGAYLTLAASIAMALSLPGTFLRRILYFFTGLAGGAFCTIVLMNLIILLVNDSGRKDGEWLIEILVSAACILAAMLSATFASCRMEGVKMLAKRSNKFLFIGWVALSVLAFCAPYFYGLSVTGYGNAFFPSTVAPFVSALVLVIAAVLGLVTKVNIKTDYVFRRIFLYWPFATLFVMLLCDTNKFLRQIYLQEITWIPFLIGYPVSAIVFSVKRLKARDRDPKNPY